MKLIDANALKEKIVDNSYLIYDYKFNSVESGMNLTGIQQAIDEMPTVEQSRWIPCNERLPEDDIPVLVYLFESNSPYIAWVSDCEWFTEEFQIEKENEPKAWMPLPAPFESEGL